MSYTNVSSPIEVTMWRFTCRNTSRGKSEMKRKEIGENRQQNRAKEKPTKSFHQID